MKKIVSALILSFIIPSIANAKQVTNATPWGYTGLITMPTADVPSAGDTNITLNYFFRDPAFSGNIHTGLFNRLELGLIGGTNNLGFTNPPIAGNLKYQIMRPSAKSPTGLAMGFAMLGGYSDKSTINQDNYLYMVLSHDFNLNIKDVIYNLGSGHIGFGGNLQNSRLMVGLDVPVTEYVSLEAEYLSRYNNGDSINFGIKTRPVPNLPNFSLNFLTMGTNLSKGFNNTEYLLNASYLFSIPFTKNLWVFDDKDEKVALCDCSKQEKISNQEPKTLISSQVEDTIDKKNISIKSNDSESNSKVVVDTKKETSVTQKVEKIELDQKKTSLSNETLPKKLEENKVIEKTNIKDKELEKTTIDTQNKNELMNSKNIVDSKVTSQDLKKEEPIKIKKGFISGKVFNPNGLLPENTYVNIKSVKQKLDSKFNVDKLGKFIINDLESGQYTISIQKEGFLLSQKQILVKDGLKTEVELELLSSRGSVSGKIVDTLSKPIKDLQIYIGKDKFTTSDANGLFKLDDIEAGYKNLLVKKDGKELESIEIDVMSGFDLNKEIVIDLKKSSNSNLSKNIVKNEQSVDIKNLEEIKTVKKKIFSLVSGKITYKSSPIKGVRVTIEGDKMTIITISDDAGFYSIKNVPIGSYKMIVSKIGYQTKELNLDIKENTELQQNFILLKK